MRRSISRGVLAALGLVLAMPAFANRISEATEIPNWSAPPQWSPGAAPAGGQAEGAEKRVEAATTFQPVFAFVGVTPCRVADTRGNGFSGPYGPPSLAGGAPRDFVIGGQCGISASAGAVSLNITVVNPSGPGFILVYPAGGTQPTVSTLNYSAGQTVANAAVVTVSAGATITVVAGVSGTDLIIDTNGWYTSGAMVNALNGFTGLLTLAAGTDLNLGIAASTFTFSANSATANTPSTLVKRDASGNFSAGTITGTQIVSTGGYKQPGTGGETLRMVRGILNGSAGCATVSGAGFTCTRTGTGSYTVTFQQAFADFPAIVVTGYTVGGNTVPASIVAETAGAFVVLTGAAVAVDTDFSFIAVGQ